jgi:hypothetical protein
MFSHVARTANVLGVILVLAAAINAASGQILRPALPPGQPLRPALPPTNPAQPQVETPAPPPTAVGTGQTAADTGGQGDVIRGSELLGLRIWDSSHQRLGTVKDFIVDYRGGCPAIFLAMAPDVTELGESYVIVPFDVTQFRFDDRDRTHYFVLDTSIGQLRRAPRLEGNRWDAIRNRSFLSDARQFYRRTEHSVARPENREGNNSQSRRESLGPNQNSNERRDLRPSEQPDRRDQAPSTERDSGTRDESRRDNNAPESRGTPPRDERNMPSAQPNVGRTREADTRDRNTTSRETLHSDAGSK